MPTKCRRAVDRAVKDLYRAYDSLRALSSELPEEAKVAGDRHARWITELGEYADYLSGVTWPDQK